MSDIQDIEDRLKADPSKVSDKDLFTYLYNKTNDENINPSKISNIPEYLNKICDSFAFENIFANTSHYGQIVALIICLLIPFYFFFPRFYKMGIVALIIGLSSFMGLVGKTNDLYSKFFPNIHIILIAVSFVFYFVFFIFINKLNHISLFFISAVISFLSITYILRIIILAKYQNLKVGESDNKKFTEYDILTEAACLEIIKRYKLKLPSGNMLYSYLTVFSFNEKTNKKEIISDIITNSLGPIISIGILGLFGYFLSGLKYHNFNKNYESIKQSNSDNIELSTIYPDSEHPNEIKHNINHNNIEEDIFSIIGISKDSDKYLFCQANYILPKEFNCDILIHDYIDKYNLETKLYNKVYKALTRITNEFLNEYNPKFSFSNEEEKNKNNNHKLRMNKIIDSIYKILEKLDENIYNNYSELIEDLLKEYNQEQISNTIYSNFIDSLKKILNNDDDNNNDMAISDPNNNNSNEYNNLEIPFEEKQKIEELLNHISNELNIENELDKNYRNNFKEYIELAKDAILGDEEIHKNDIKKIKDILENYQDDLFKNLGLKNNITNNYPNTYQSSKLYGYFYNIIGYNIHFPGEEYIKNGTKIFFKYLLRLISTWILFSKPIGSGWFLSKCMLLQPSANDESYQESIQDFKNIIGSKSFIWKYFLMGLDTSNIKLEEFKKDSEDEQNPGSDIFKIIKNFGMTFGLSIITIPLLMYYNTTVFGFQSTPSWMNLVIQIVIIINILYNHFIITKSIKAEENVDKSIPKTAGQKFLDFFRLSYRNFNIIYFVIIIIIILCVILIPR